jgi:hypothetical protein
MHRAAIAAKKAKYILCIILLFGCMQFAVIRTYGRKYFARILIIVSQTCMQYNICFTFQNKLNISVG